MKTPEEILILALKLWVILFAAVGILFVASFFLAGCSVPEPKAPQTHGPSRDEVRAAIYSSEYGIHKMVGECSNQAGDLLEKGNLDRADLLVQICGDHLQGARDAFAGMLKELDDWQEASPLRIGCTMPPVVSAYKHVLPMLQAAGFVSGATEDGGMRAVWLAHLCPTTGAER